MLPCIFGDSPASWSPLPLSGARNPAPKMPWRWGKSKDNRKGCKDVAVAVDGGESPRAHSVPGRRGAPKVEDEQPVPTGRQQPSRLNIDVTPQNSDPRSVFALGYLCSRSPSPSTPSTRCPSFNNDKKPPALPLPLPTPLGRTASGNALPTPTGSSRAMQPPVPLPSSEAASPRIVAYEGCEVDLGNSGPASCTNSSVSSLGSVEVLESWNQSNAAASRMRPSYDTEASEPVRQPSLGLGPSTPKHSRKNSKHDASRPTSPRPSSQTPSTSPSKGYSDPKRSLSPLRLEPTSYRFGPLNGSNPDSPARSPRRVSNSEGVYSRGLWLRHEGDISGSAHCTSPGSGQTSGHNSSNPDAAQMLWMTPNKRSPEPSPIPSPRQRSPGQRSPGPSGTPSGTVSPLHPRSSWAEEGMPAAHPLPLPPLTRAGGGSSLISPPVSPSAAAGRALSRGDSGVGICQNQSRWQKGKLLGSGTFGNVYLVFNSDNGALCAMKEVLLVSDDSKSKESVKQLGQEIALLSKLRHMNIVQYVGTEALEDRLCIYLEYVSGGSIHKLLQDYGAFKEPVVRSFTRQVVEGLAYLHHNKTVHRDVKGANILVDTNGKVKLADFGMAKHITDQSFPLSFKGSPYWMAPEVIKHTYGYDFSVDIWSLGCTVLEMATSKPPWSQYEGVAAMFKIGNSKELPAIPDYMSSEGKDFVKLCLQRDPAQRPTAQRLLQHPFVEIADTVQDDKFDYFSNTTAGMQNLQSASQQSAPQPSPLQQSSPQQFAQRHDSDVGFTPPVARPRQQLSPTPSDLSRNVTPVYGSPNPPSLSPTAQSRRHVYNGVASSLLHSPGMQSGTSSPHAGGYSSSHPNSHANAPGGSAQGVSHAYIYGNGNYGAVPGSYNDGYANASRFYGTNPFKAGGYPEPLRSEPHGTASHRTHEGSERSPRGRALLLERDALGKALGRASHDGEDSRRRNYNVNGALVERLKYMHPGLYHTPSSPTLSHANSGLSH